jgi:hypothetical protein
VSETLGHMEDTELHVRHWATHSSTSACRLGPTRPRSDRTKPRSPPAVCREARRQYAAKPAGNKRRTAQTLLAAFTRFESRDLMRAARLRWIVFFAAA